MITSNFLSWTINQNTSMLAAIMLITFMSFIAQFICCVYNTCWYSIFNRVHLRCWQAERDRLTLTGIWEIGKTENLCYVKASNSSTVRRVLDHNVVFKAFPSRVTCGKPCWSVWLLQLELCLFAIKHHSALLGKMETFTVCMKTEISQIIIAMIEIVGKVVFDLVLSQSQSAFWPDLLMLSGP